MEYRHTQAHENYAMYAGGGVFYSAPGLTAFPVRLAVEIFRRCLAIRAAQGAQGPAVVYDPCCGGAYHLATMAYFNWDQILQIHGSDIDGDALSVAVRNLSLLTLTGMDRRIEELTSLNERFGKPAHAVSLQNAYTLRQRLLELSQAHQIRTGIFQADAGDKQTIAATMAGVKVDIVIADIPYGRSSAWHAGTAALLQAQDPVEQLLGALLPVLGERPVVAIAAAKKDKIKHASYRRLEKYSVGRRQVAIVQPT